ncbi:hypothetical protein BHE74_00059746 [Ensete ventricosum]|nr:hypothetical protein GW17_00033332 [Ensete ventricosum]RWW35335.1 hypothetical protein BHE74_00059746 [Ensete ventricosum]RZS19004.1 hypothetical protein BHM03_00051345 [Ensete ventricosum]
MHQSEKKESTNQWDSENQTREITAGYNLWNKCHKSSSYCTLRKQGREMRGTGLDEQSAAENAAARRSRMGCFRCTILRRSTTEGCRTRSPTRHLRGGKGKGRREKAAAGGDQIRLGVKKDGVS